MAFIMPRLTGPKIVRVGKRLVARPTAPATKRREVNLADLVATERSRWPAYNLKQAKS
jgi:hypothetical protein